MTFKRFSSHRMGRSTAAVVAILFALQGLLASALSAQMTVAEALGPYVICVSSGESPTIPDETPAPVHHMDCAICAFAAISPLVPVLLAVLAPPAQAATVVQATSRPTLIVSRPSDPRTSRGPPVLL